MAMTITLVYSQKTTHVSFGYTICGDFFLFTSVSAVSVIWKIVVETQPSDSGLFYYVS